MISGIFKPAVTRLITPVAAIALRVGVTANGVTWVGAIGVVASSLYFYPRGELFLGTAVICLFALSDLFDGTLARISNRGASRWGSFLDSTIDRVTDSAILMTLAVYLLEKNDRLVIIVLITLVTGLLVPYIRAKAEIFAIVCSGGIAERTERLILCLSAIALEGLGVPYAMAIGFWILSIVGVITVIQRLLIVKNAVG